MNPNELIQRYLTGEATATEVAELDHLLANDKALRRKLIIEAGTDAGLRQIALERVAQPVMSAPKKVARFYRPVAWLAAAAAVALMGVVGWTEFSRPQVIATLISGENASWESSLPTTPGSELTAGYLKLTSGIATIRFRSGAEVILEAPAHLVLETPMRGRLLAGSAVIEVPEPAIGFVMVTPDGYAVDYGTQFAISVNTADNSSDFEVLKGEIAVHHPATGKEVRLTRRQGALISANEMITFNGEDQEPAIAEPSQKVRIGTLGQAGYVNRRNKRGKHLQPEMLMVKQTESFNWDMRAFFSFDVSGVDLESVQSARLRLNQVPSGMGLAARLPLINTFAVYGVTHAEKETWSSAPTWEDAPDVADGVLLGTFDIPRSQQTGSYGIENDKLREFLRADPDKKVTFVIVRETGLIDGEGKGLTHAFASDHHPEASGPLLEFTMKSAVPASK